MTEHAAPYNPDLCKERMDRLRSDLNAGLGSVRQEIEAKNNLSIVKNEGRSQAVDAAIKRIDAADETHGKKIKALEDQMPTDCIDRLANLEGWRKYIIGSFASSALFIVLLWRYVNHILTEHAGTIAQAAELVDKIEQLGIVNK